MVVFEPRVDGSLKLFSSRDLWAWLDNPLTISEPPDAGEMYQPLLDSIFAG